MDLDMETHWVGANTITPGITRSCPICNATLANAEMGVNAHLRSHIRKKEISREEEQSLRCLILRRTYKEA